MNQLLILSGPPATGKSTHRKELVAQGWAYTNLDELRIANPDNRERQIHDMQHMMLLGFMADGRDIVIDNLNLNPKTVSRYKTMGAQYGYTVTVKNFGHDIHWSEAVRRDSLREGTARVGKSVIIQSYMQAGLYKDPLRTAVIFDVDGTLANCDHRQHFMEETPKNWRGFNAAMAQDTLNISIGALYHIVARQGLTPIIVSGRSADFRRVTETWLHNALDINDQYFALFMRGFNDSRDDAIVKKEIYDTYIDPYFDTLFVVDDRPKVIRMWRAQGLTTLDCGKGIEF